VEAVVTKEYIDLCVNGVRTMISRSGKQYNYLRFFSQFGTAEFHKITYRELE
jgi:beta-fructofuranosidase